MSMQLNNRDVAAVVMRHFRWLNQNLEVLLNQSEKTIQKTVQKVTEGVVTVHRYLSTYLWGEDAQVWHRMEEAIAQRDNALKQQMRLFTALSQIGKMILHINSPQLLFERVCEIAVSNGGFKAAWVGCLDREDGVIYPVAGSGLDLEQLKLCEFDLDLTDPQAEGPLALAVYGKCPSIINESQANEGKTMWHRLACCSGGGSAAVFPILVRREVVATLTVYAESPGYFTSVIQELLEGMICSLSFAMESMTRDQAQKAAYESLQTSSEQLEAAHQTLSRMLASVSDGIFGVDEHDICTFANQAAVDMLGYTHDELQGEPIHKLVRISAAAEESFNQIVQNSDYEDGFRDESFIHKNEGFVSVEYAISPIWENGLFKGSVTVFRDATPRRSMLREMRFLATHDMLTHLVNRHAFDQRLRQAFLQTREQDVQHVLLYMDLNQFKLVNDTCGHLAGDVMLRQLAHQLHLTVGDEGVLARLGGDQFALLVEGCDLSQASKLANEICYAVKEFRFLWEGHSYTTDISVGMTAIGPNTKSPRAALSAADTACYVAKDMGRNRVHVYQSHDEEVYRQQAGANLLSKIEDAINHERLSLQQQPIMSLSDRAIGDEHIEVLLRMHDEQGKLLMPDIFIPPAERYNIMVKLDQWVIRQTFQWLSEHPVRLEELGCCAINLSAQSMNDSVLHEYILAKLHEYKLPADKISFEITETAVVHRLGRAKRFINLLKKQGFRVGLDDFGAGISSYTYLKHLPVDYLKIDGGVVCNILSDPVSRTVVDSINQIGHLMGVQTVAESVEDDQILEHLIDIGVDYAQGYAVVQPTPLNPNESVRFPGGARSVPPSA
jgi:diguanylate cyclase (GGDEF)-like protein/PAS domain S-box-containing protein